MLQLDFGVFAVFDSIDPDLLACNIDANLRDRVAVPPLRAMTKARAR